MLSHICHLSTLEAKAFGCKLETSIVYIMSSWVAMASKHSVSKQSKQKQAKNIKTKNINMEQN